MLLLRSFKAEDMGEESAPCPPRPHRVSSISCAKLWWGWNDLSVMCSACAWNASVFSTCLIDNHCYCLKFILISINNLHGSTWICHRCFSPSILRTGLFFLPKSSLVFILSFEKYLLSPWQCTPVLLPGKSHGQRSLVGYSPWGHKESDTTERLHLFTYHNSGTVLGT